MVLDVPAPKEFPVTTEPSTVAQRWKKWSCSFEFYFIATVVGKEEQKRALLLHIAGPEVQDIFATLTTTAYLQGSHYSFTQLLFTQD